MIESLLYPKKLEMPPRLDMNPAAMFGEITYRDPIEGIEEKKVSLLQADTKDKGTVVRCKDIENTPDGDIIHLGIMIPLDLALPLEKQDPPSGYISLPFQSEMISKANFKTLEVHGWPKPNADITTPPMKSKEFPDVGDGIIILGVPVTMDSADQGSGNLFHMSGNDLVDMGQGQQFASVGTWFALRYKMTPDLFSYLSVLAQNIFSLYGENGTIATEIIIRIPIDRYMGDNGFTVGAAKF